MLTNRVIVWFSCGAASACAARLAITEYPDALVVYCDTSKTESSDNPRFMADVERWIGKRVTIIRSGKYATVDDVFMGERYMAGPGGARCTVEMKKVPRFEFQRPDDLHIFGYTKDEKKRIRLFEQNNPELATDWILVRHDMTKARCLAMVTDAGIALPVLYAQGFKNNNCIGCVKATSPEYWNRVRTFYPDVFKRRVSQSRELNVRLVEFHGERIFLDEMPSVSGPITEDLSCGPYCQIGDNAK